MKILVSTLAVFLAAVTTLTVFAAEEKNLAYYDPDFPRTGSPDYLAERCRLDLSLPDGEKNFPVLVWFHGGGITAGSKHFPAGIDRRKIAVAAVNYRLSGRGASCPDYLFDAAAATAWVLRHISERGGDPSMVYLSGHSAGGYLSAMIALDPKYLQSFGAAPAQLAGVLPISGQMTTHFQVLAERRATDPQTPDIAIDEYAPIFHASGNAPALTLIAGDSDIEWPARVEENLLLAARLRRNFKDGRVRCLTFESFDHGTVLTPGIAVVNNTILRDLKERDWKAARESSRPDASVK